MKLKNACQMALAALVWGIAFVAQSSASDVVGPFTFGMIRCILGALALMPLIYIKNKTDKTVLDSLKKTENQKLPIGLIGGIACGLFLFLGANLQQFGIAYTTVGKSGFITALYIIFVPIASALFFHKRMSLPVVLSAVLGLLGLYLLCIKEGFSIGIGDLLTLFCAFAFTAHILVIDHYTTRVDGVLLSCLQFLVMAMICIPFCFLLEHPTLSQIWQAKIPILYSGVISCGVGYTLQIVGQKDMNPTISSLILSLESVFSALAGWIILKQSLSGRELLGCLIMFSAIVLANTGDYLSQLMKNRK